MPARGQTVDTIFPTPSTSIGTDIHALLGTKPKPVRAATGLISNPGTMIAQSVPVKPTKDRPTIAKGGLAPAPPGKKKGLSLLYEAELLIPIPVPKDLDHGWPTSRPGVGTSERPEVTRAGTSIGGNSLRSMGGVSVAGGGGKWADRMRARK